MLRKILKITGITVLVFLLILFIAPFVFRGKIIALAKSEINKNINAKADFADASISLFRRFPRVSLLLEDLRITGIQGFAQDTLISAGKVDVALNLMSVIRGSNMKIYSVEIDEPRIFATVNSLGKPNWDIMKPDSTTAVSDSSKPFKVELNRYAINNAFIVYSDSSLGMNAQIEKLKHEGSGDFTADLFTLSTATSADSVSFSYGGIPYLNKVKVDIDVDLEVDAKTSKYSFTTDQILINDLKIATSGFFQLVDDSTYNMDIKFNAPSTDFKNILSLVPAVYSKDFAKVKSSGKAIISGFVKGVMAGEKIPAYNLNVDIQNGFFQYPDLPVSMKNINVAVKVDNPDGVTDHTTVNIPKGHFEVENDPFDFNLMLTNPVTNMFIDGSAKGRLDLSKIARLVKLEAGTKLQGLLNADVNVKGSVDAAQRQQFDQFNAGGTIRLNDFMYSSKDYPGGVAISRMLMTFNPQNVVLSDAAGKYLSTNWQANGTINNLLAYALKDQSMEGVLNVIADKVKVNEFMGSVDTTATTTTTTQAFIVPSNLDITINAKADQVTYDNLDIRNLTGSLQLADEAIKLDNINGNALDGTINISGTYSTRVNKVKPAITLEYEVKDVDVQKTFFAFNTVQKLMPIGKWLGGKLNSKLSVSGLLGDGMMPDLSSLTGNGNLFLIEGFLQKFKPLEKIAERLNVNELQDVTLREVRQYFEFTNGKVLVKPFNVKYQNIDMEIGGMHGIDQSMDYTINMKVPRSLIGAKGNEFVNDLSAKAAARGIPLKVSDVVNFNIGLGGTITNPTIAVNLKETASTLAEDMKEQVKEFAQAKVDSAKKAVRDTLQSLKKEAIQEVSDKLKKELFGKKDSAALADSAKKTNPADRLKESGKGLLKNINPLRKKDTARKE